MNYSYENDQVTLCQENTCLSLRGDNAQIVSNIITVVAFVVGIAAIAKALR